MVMVEIDSNVILVEPMESCKDAKMIRAYDTLLNQLKRAGIVPKKHVLNNGVSENMKNHICGRHRLNMELVPLGCHRRNAADVAIKSSKPISSAYSQGHPMTFHQAYGIDYYHKPKITINLT